MNQRLSNPYLRPKILVAEDDPDQRELLCEALVDLGFNVESAVDGAAALSALKTGKHNLAILDLKMPVMSGREVLESIRTENKRIPIVMVSAFLSPIDRAALIGEGADCCLSKPFALPVMIETVNGLLRRT